MMSPGMRSAGRVLTRCVQSQEEWHARLEAREATPPGSASELERARARANSKQTPHDAEHWTKWVESAGVLALCCAEEEARARGLRLLFMASTIRSQAHLSASSGGGGCAAVAALVVAAMEECKRRSEASEGCDDAYDFCARQDRDLHSSSSSSSSASAVAGGSDATLLSLLEMSKRRRGVHSEEWPGTPRAHMFLCFQCTLQSCTRIWYLPMHLLQHIRQRGLCSRHNIPAVFKTAHRATRAGFRVDGQRGAVSP